MSLGETMKALSDPVRREILTLLKGGRLSAGEIGAHFEMTGATVSYHLKVLKRADLVYETRERNFIYYALNTSVLEDLLLWVTDLRGGAAAEDSTPEGRSSDDTAKIGPETEGRNLQ